MKRSKENHGFMHIQNHHILLVLTVTGCGIHKFINDISRTTRQKFKSKNIWIKQGLWYCQSKNLTVHFLLQCSSVFLSTMYCLLCRHQR